MWYNFWPVADLSFECTLIIRKITIKRSSRFYVWGIVSENIKAIFGIPCAYESAVGRIKLHGAGFKKYFPRT